MKELTALLAVTLVAGATLAVGAFGLRVSRTTSDFFVASRRVGPFLNASAIGGEYLSAASFLGVAGLVLLRGVDMLWYPIGYTAGYLLLLVFVAAPLRRSGAYTLPDFAEFRVESQSARQVASWLVCLIGGLYLVPQFQGAGLTLSAVTGAPTWAGALLVAVVVLVNVVAGGMRSITLVQAFQYWVKLTALLAPALVLWLAWHHDGSPSRNLHSAQWVEPLQGPHATYLTYSLIVATFLGAMGLPHVVVRFYTNHDGAAARSTTLGVLTMLSVFYLLPTAYGVLGRVYDTSLIAQGRTDSVVLELPGKILGGTGSTLVTALLGAGAFAAFLSTSSGLVVSISGVLSQDLLSRRFDNVTGFRIGGVLAAGGALLLAAVSQGLPVAHAVELAFAVAASTFCPLLLLGIWWRGLTARGAVAGMVGGGTLAGTAVLAAMVGVHPPGMAGALLAQPALLTVPIAFATMVGVSLADRAHVPVHVGRAMVRLHLPEALEVDRGGYHPSS
ncbi:MAG TPA: cation acetate symporter [Nocardioides sp.]|jgi:Na+(H+)/acetate symporter ActP|uniref:sodium/solute symporter n=1 Tax=Nocardioides sp. TaxID=35761 RepID=UPI002E36C56E|nr:cation acetate symporter [Nocardioides sp.]HEX3932404.1 cation acetate symporter [Nocardioides sp.]